MSSAGRLGDTAALRRVRAVLRERRDRRRPATGDIAYAVYFGILLVICAVAPVVRSVLLWLVEVLPSPEVPWIYTAAAWVLGIAALFVPVAGTYFGPVRATLPEIDLLLTTALPRRLLHGRGIVWAFVLGGAIGGIFVGLPCAAWVLRGDLALVGAVMPLCWGVLIGMICVGLLWLGQAIRGTGWQALRDQALQFDAVSTLAVTGDLRAASTRMGAPVRVGRRWRWRAPRPLVAAIASRDLLGIVRTPLRSTVALVTSFAAGAAAGAAAQATSFVPAALLGAAAALGAYAAIGPWCRGLRTAGDAAGAPALLPASTTGLLLRHLVAPGALAALAMTAGAWLGALFGGTLTYITSADSVRAGTPLVAGGVLAVFALSLRMLGSVKGPLPERLLAPVPTPVGDMSGVNILLWSLDGPVWAVVVGAVTSGAAVVSPAAAILVALVAIAAIFAGVAGRLRAFRA